MTRIYIAIAALLALYGWMGNEDMQAAEDSAAYTAEIMEQAKQQALMKEDFNRLREWGEQYVPQRVAMGVGDE